MVPFCTIITLPGILFLTSNYHLKILIMRKISFLITALALSSIFLSCGSGPQKKNLNLEEAKKAIAESNAIYFQSFAKNDSSVFINRYAEDACTLAPNVPESCGRPGQAAFFRDAYKHYGLRNGKFITTAVYGNGDDYVTEEGLWQSVDSAGKQFDNGKFLVLWKKTKDGWKMYRDSFSSNSKINSK